MAKLNINYNQLHKTINNLENNKLNDVDLVVLYEFVKAAEGELYPSQDELQMQEIRLKKLADIQELCGHEKKWNFQKSESEKLYTKKWDILMKECSEFENKYC
jgi:hypothetical protein